MEKKFKIFEITYNGKLKQADLDRYENEPEAIEVIEKYLKDGEYVILPIYIKNSI